MEYSVLLILSHVDNLSTGPFIQPFVVASPVMYNSPVGGIGTATSRYGVMTILITLEYNGTLLFASEALILNSKLCGISSCRLSLVRTEFKSFSVKVFDRSDEMETSCGAEKLEPVVSNCSR